MEKIATDMGAYCIERVEKKMKKKKNVQTLYVVCFLINRCLENYQPNGNKQTSKAYTIYFISFILLTECANMSISIIRAHSFYNIISMDLKCLVFLFYCCCGK